ncbi:MAG: hypothetical protein N3A63_06840 [Bacteroidetes bacterium]|nr:hypothetical protein [Bacteroidota bacterium]
MKCIATVLLMCPILLIAQHHTSERQTVDLTIYNQDLALIREERSVRLQSGTITVVVPDVPATIDGTTIHCVSLTAPHDVRVLEQSYQYDLIHQAKLLEKYLGKEIEFIRVNPLTKEELTVKGVLLSSGWTQHGGPYGGYTATGSMIARINGKVEIAPEGRIVLPLLPEGLILKPQLEWKLLVKKAGTHILELSYLAHRINWECSYVAVLSETETMLDVTGWITITNNTGSHFMNASLKLVAGDLTILRTQEFQRIGSMALKADAHAEEGIQQRDFFEYKLYTLQQKTDIRANETKQIELLSARGVKGEKLYVYDGLSSDWKWWKHNPSYRDQGSFGHQSTSKVGVYVLVKNSEEYRLGYPLPKGKVRVYKQDVDRKVQFIGEDIIDHTPKNEEVRLLLGYAFDLVGKRIQKDFKVVVPGHSVEETIEISLKNHKRENVSVTVYEHPWRWHEWSIVRSNEQWTNVDQSTIRCTVQLKPEEERLLVVVLRYRW